jgi:hypothetical protein
MRRHLGGLDLDAPAFARVPFDVASLCSAGAGSNLHPRELTGERAEASEARRRIGQFSSSHTAAGERDEDNGTRDCIAREPTGRYLNRD